MIEGEETEKERKGKEQTASKCDYLWVMRLALHTFEAFVVVLRFHWWQLLHLLLCPNAASASSALILSLLLLLLLLLLF